MAEERDERTERATPRKIREAREEGNVAKSREISSVAVLLAALMTLYLAGGTMFTNLLNVTNRSLMDAGSIHLTSERIHLLLVDSIMDISIIIFPVLLGTFLFALFSNIAQVGFLFSSKAITPKMDKINPINGFKNLVSLRSLVELLKSIAKIALVAYAAYFAIQSEVEDIPPLMLMSPWEIITFMSSISFNILLKSSWVLLALAIMDYSFQRWQYLKNLRMTKQEVKDEMKQQEGDPHIKARIKSLQREYASRRMMEEVPKADVVITNPIHFAIALKYNKEDMGAPVVVAKGRSHLARRIRELAIESKVPVVEDKPLARALYKSIEIGQEVPASLYKAVAEVLAYVYRLKKRFQH